MLCLTKLSFTVKLFTEWICYFTICHLISITAITLDSCLCWLMTTAETGDIFSQVLALLTWKSLKWSFLLSHKRLPQNLHKFFISFFQNISLMSPLVNPPCSRIISQQSIIRKCFRNTFKYAKWQLQIPNPGLCKGKFYNIKWNW